MFVAMMFVQTPAMASSNAVLTNNGFNTKSTDYQSDSQFSSGKTATVSNNIGKSNLNGNAQVTSVPEKVVTYNSSGSLIEMNSSYVNPGQYINISVQTSQLNNFRFNNSFIYSLKSPIGQEPFNSSAIYLSNTTVGNTPLTTTWEGQNLTGQLMYNSSSYSQYYGVNILNVVNSSYSATTEKVIWDTKGFTTTKISYSSTDNTSLPSSCTTTCISKEINTLNTSHTIFLTMLQPNMTYYYRLYGVDIFNRVINSSIYSFKTPVVSTGIPYITSNTIQLTVTNNTIKDIQFNPNIGSDYVIYFNTKKSLVDSSVPSSAGSFPVLDSGKQYYFKLVLRNQNNPSLNTTYDNGGMFYSFFTQQDAVTLTMADLTNPLTFNATTSQKTIQFATDVETNASVLYSTDPNFVTNVQTIGFDNMSLSHIFTINVTSGARYYFKLNVTDGMNYYTIIKSNSVKSQNFGITTLATYQLGFYSFTTPVNSSQDIETSYFLFIFEIPTYPAVLGHWQLSVFLNQTPILNSDVASASVNPFNNLFPSYSTFLVNDSIEFNPKVTLIQRGTLVNGTGTFPVWKIAANGDIYSPTDNLTFIGSLKYSTSTQPINVSDWGSAGSEYRSSAYINLYYSDNLISSSATNIISAFNLYNTISNPNGFKINSSLIPSLNPNIDNILSITIPAMDIYGNVSASLGLVMPHSGVTGFTQVQQTIRSLNVKYKLEVTNHTGKSSGVLTSSNFVGSATVYPLQYVNIESAYPNSNVSNFLKIPGQAIHLNLSVTLNNVEQNILVLTRENYTWYWHRDSLDSSLQKGNYTVKLLWTGLDGSSRSLVATSGSVYGTSPSEFSTFFILRVSYTIKDLTANITVLPENIVTLRFKVVVPETGVAWDRDLNIITSKDIKCVFDQVTGEYSVNITAPALSGSKSQIEQVTLKSSVSGVTFENSTLTYMVSSKLSSQTLSNGNTKSNVDVRISLIGFGYIGIAVIAVVAYAGVIFYFIRRK